VSQTSASYAYYVLQFYSNFFEFLMNFCEFRENSKQRERMLTNACKALAKHWLSRHHPTFGAAYILDEVFI